MSTWFYEKIMDSKKNQQGSPKSARTISNPSIMDVKGHITQTTIVSFIVLTKLWTILLRLKIK